MTDLARRQREIVERELADMLPREINTAHISYWNGYKQGVVDVLGKILAAFDALKENSDDDN